MSKNVVEHYRVTSCPICPFFSSEDGYCTLLEDYVPNWDAEEVEIPDDCDLRKVNVLITMEN